MSEEAIRETRTTTAPDPVRAARIGALLALATVLSGLFYYKWSASLRVVDRTQTTGHLPVDPGLLLQGGPWTSTLAYFTKIWPALAYGIAIGAVVRAAVPPTWIARALGKTGLRGALVGGVAGAPLMLCSCCVTPVFTGLYERGARLSSSLALMLGAPGFNLAALGLTFALLPAKLAMTRAICAVAIVVGLPTLLGRMNLGDATSASCAVRPDPAQALGFVHRFLRSVVYLSLVTVPLIGIGVVLGGLAMPHLADLSALGTVAGVVLVAFVSVLVALPTFFEIPLALLMLQMGAPEGTAVAMLVAGPIVNLPSLLVLGRETRPRLAVVLGLAVWAIATLAGLATSV
jgi:uncharacterized membrane protein YraQ (UPF0718 family)